ELGLAGRQVGTTGVRPLIYSGGRLHQMPQGTLQGIPAQAASLAGLGADATVAELVGDRFGPQVVTRSVDPLLAGVYAGSAATIGLRAALPPLGAAMDRGARSLTDAVRE